MSKPCQEHDWIAPQQATRATPQDVDQARNQQLDQLKANAKTNKKHVDRLTARLGKAFDQRDAAEKEAAFYRAELERYVSTAPPVRPMISRADRNAPNKSDRTKWSTLLLGAGFAYL